MSSLLEWVAIGDALGLPFEFKTSRVMNINKTGIVEDWQSRKGGRYYSHTEDYSGSTYSDDTQMMLLVLGVCYFEWEQNEVIEHRLDNVWCNAGVGISNNRSNAVSNAIDFAEAVLV